MRICKPIQCLAIAAGLAMSAAMLSTAANAVDNMSTGGEVDLTSVRAKIDKRDFAAALSELRALAADNQNADVYNLLGFTLRKTGDTTTALSYYTRALDLQPDHKGAHEYLGELYVETGDMAKANEQLAALSKLCPAGCEELSDLKKAIAEKKFN